MRVPGRFAIVAALLGVGGLSGLAAAPVLAAPSLSVSFFTQGGATAMWTSGHTGIQLFVPNPSSYAIVVFHHFSSAPAPEAPSFTTDTYASGSPRWYIQFAAVSPAPSGGYLFGYPAQYPNWEVVNCATGDGVYASYGLALAALETGCSDPSPTVTGVYIVADSSQGTPATDTLTSVQYGGTYVTK